MQPPKSSRKGFTLLEVMVAVAVLGIAMTAIHYGQAQSIRAQARSQNVTLAAMKAMEKMEEILIAEELTDGILEGEFEDGFRWKAEILLPEPDEEGEDAELPFKTFSIWVDIIWGAGKQEKHFQIGTMKIAQELEVAS